MQRRLAIFIAAGALVLASSAPAFADHEEPELFEDGPGGNTTCEEVGARVGADIVPPPAHADWDDTGKVEPPVELDNEFVTATFTEFNDDDEPTHLTVTAKPGFVVTAVIVKGGPASNAYTQEPFHDMHAPGVGQNQNIPGISHYTICGEETDDDNGNGDNGNGDNGDDGNGEEPTKTPVPVPTDVPAGAVNSILGGGSAGLVGLLAIAAVATAGIAVIALRRFRHGS
jgi:hypothetical protein